MDSASGSYQYDDVGNINDQGVVPLRRLELFGYLSYGYMYTCKEKNTVVSIYVHYKLFVVTLF